MAALGACGAGGGGSGPADIPGQELSKPDGSGTFFVDPNQGGHATRLHLAEMFWGRLVDVHDVDEQGRTNLQPLFRDFVVSENIQSDASNYRLEINPITQKARLVVLRSKGAPDTGQGTFDSLLRFAADNLAPVVPKNDDGSSSQPFSFVARNATLVLRLDDVLQDDLDAQRDLADNVRVRVGYPPETPFPARHVFDPNHGAIVGEEFHSTRVLVDLTISESESATMVSPQPVNAVGLPASLTTSTNPDVSVRVPTRLDFGSGQFTLLRGLSGVPLAPFENGPVDSDGTTQDIVRALRSGNPNDLNNGFLLDLNAPAVVGGWALRVDSALPDPQGQAGFDFLLDATFTTVCSGAPALGDVLSVGERFLEVTLDSAPPDLDGEVHDLHARNLADQPISSGGSLLGNATFLSTFLPTATVPPGCWITFAPQPVQLPATGVLTSSQVLVRFSEPMDPLSLSPFDTFFLVRGDSNTLPIPTNLIVGEIRASSDLKGFTFDPVLDLPHDTATIETYHVQIDGPTDLAGNALADGLPPINFTMDPDQPAVQTSGTVLRFTGTDELEPIGLPDLRGQFFLDFDRGLIRPRPVAYTAYAADRLNPVPSIMIPFAPGVQTPLSPLGSKLHTIWRYCDLGWQVLDETKYNLDVFGLSWAPIGGQVVSDFYEAFEIRLAHSRRQPDEAIDQNLLPKYPNSGLVGAPQKFDDNMLVDPLSPQKVVHDRGLGYRISAADLFLASSGTIMLPYPLNRDPDLPHVTYTWRDTTVLAKGGPSGTGIPLDIEAGAPLNLEDKDGYVARPNEVPSFGLPLLMEFRCYPSDTGIGLNSLDISLAINSSAIPSFRSFSTGGYNTSQIAVLKNPDEELVPSGGYNPSSRPPGQRTAREDDNSFYVGQLDAVTRVSRVHTVWINTNLDAPDFVDPIVLPRAIDQPAGTQVILEYRGADGFEVPDIDSEYDPPPDPPIDETTFPFDAKRLNAYGDIFAVIPVGSTPATEVDSYEVLGSSEFPGGVQYVTGSPIWEADIDAVDGARYVQLRITFLNNIETGLNPELSSVGIAYSGQ